MKSCKALKYLTSSIGLFMLPLAACSTAPHVISSLAEESLELKQGILLPYKLVPGAVVIAEEGCTLSLNHAGEHITYDIPIKPGKSTIVVQLPVGVYGFELLTCGSGQFEFSSKNNFEVYPNKLSFMGELSVGFKTRRSSIFDMGERITNQKDLVKSFHDFKGFQEVVSGYTGHEIDLDHAEKSMQFDHRETLNSIGLPIKNTTNSWPDLNGCYRMEHESNPLWLGNAVISASYFGSALTHIEMNDSWNTFTEKFKNCVKDTVTHFRPLNSRELTYKIYL